MTQTPDNPSADSATRFFFDDCDVRGEMVTLNSTVTEAVRHQKLPSEAKLLLAEFLSAAALLAGILKFKGILTLQIRGDGLIPLIMAESNHERHLRGVAKLATDDSGAEINSAELAGKTLRELVGNGVLTLTIDPEQGQRYQGIVPLEGNTIAECLTHYFCQSEQLPTRLWLYGSGSGAGGFFLQALPASDHSDDGQKRREDWRTLETLADTLTTQESLTLEHDVQLMRLFHEFSLRIASHTPVRFECTCSQERSENAVAAIGHVDAYALLKEQQTINIDCQFCGQHYALNAGDLDRIFGQNNTLH